MNINFFLETILFLLAILASNGFIYSLTFFHFNNQNSSENISVIRNSSENNVLDLTLLIASNPIILTSSESSSSQTLSVISSESSTSQTLSVSSSDTYVSEDLFDSTDLDLLDGVTSEDSLTILNRQTFEEWTDIVKDLHDLPFNTPANILQQVKFEELNILYSQDIIHFSITQTELRLIIELIPAMDLFNPGINHFILTIMSFYHL